MDAVTAATSARSESAQPVLQESDARDSGFLRVELRGGERTVFDGGDEALAVLRPGDARRRECAGRLQRPVARRVGVHEVEALVADAREAGGEIAKEPYSLPGATTTLAFLKDPNGISLEFCCLTRDVGNEDDVTMQERAEVSIERWLGDNYINARISSRVEEPALAND